VQALGPDHLVDLRRVRELVVDEVVRSPERRALLLGPVAEAVPGHQAQTHGQGGGLPVGTVHDGVAVGPAQADVGHVEVEQPAGLVGRHPEQALHGLLLHGVLGGVDQRDQVALATAALVGGQAQLQGEPDAAVELGELLGGARAAVGVVQQLLETGGRRAVGQQGQHGRGVVRRRDLGWLHGAHLTICSSAVTRIT
jgi:hypothetical protein